VFGIRSAAVRLVFGWLSGWGRRFPPHSGGDDEQDTIPKPGGLGSVSLRGGGSVQRAFTEYSMNVRCLFNAAWPAFFPALFLFSR
jgi:hypothetical protein